MFRVSINQIYDFCKEIFPINRSITGSGVRETLSIIQRELTDLKLHTIPTGEKCFDWRIPMEWNVIDAYIVDPDGKKICNFKDNNLHLMGYSIPINMTIELGELEKNLHSLPGQPNAIPYITSYYKEEWGFCLTHNQRKKLKKGVYTIFIDSSLNNGELTYGELLIKGDTKEEIFFSTYICHPSMGNNEVSGPSVVTYLSKYILSKVNLRYSYRIIFIPETIGSIAYLSKNLEDMKQNLVAGFNVTCVGDDNNYSFMPSKNGSTLSDKVALHVLKNKQPKFKAFSKGILKGLLPDDLEKRVVLIDENCTTIQDDILGVKYDLFGDDSIYAVPLPGHAAGQIGILLETEKKPYFLIADAVWLKKSYEEFILPNSIVKLFIHSWSDFKTSLKKVHKFHQKHPETIVVQTHCA